MKQECGICGRCFGSERGLSVHKGRSHKPSYQDEEWLRNEYCNKEKSTVKISEETETDTMTIKYWLDKHGIETRHRGHRQLWSDSKPPKEKLYNLYWGEKMSTVDIGEKFGVVASTVANWLRSYSIDVRSRADSLNLKIPPKEDLAELHYEDELKLYEIGELYDVDGRTVSGWFSQLGIEVRTYSGKEAPRWDGGHEKYYGPNWEEEREARLEYDNHECVVCGMSNEEHKERNGRALHLHHIQKLREFKRPDGSVDYKRANRIENLVTLCESDHKKWEGIPLRPQQ